MFYLLVSLASAVKNSSSIVSLHGKIVSGVAKRMTISIPNKDI
jgi:hypothetical protein